MVRRRNGGSSCRREYRRVEEDGGHAVFLRPRFTHDDMMPAAAERICYTLVTWRLFFFFAAVSPCSMSLLPTALTLFTLLSAADARHAMPRCSPRHMPLPCPPCLRATVFSASHALNMSMRRLPPSATPLRHYRRRARRFNGDEARGRGAKAYARQEAAVEVYTMMIISRMASRVDAYAACSYAQTHGENLRVVLSPEIITMSRLPLVYRHATVFTTLSTAFDTLPSAFFFDICCRHRGASVLATPCWIRVIPDDYRMVAAINIIFIPSRHIRFL